MDKKYQLTIRVPSGMNVLEGSELLARFRNVRQEKILVNKWSTNVTYGPLGLTEAQKLREDALKTGFEVDSIYYM